MTATSRSMRGLTTDEVIRCLRDGTRDMTQMIYKQVPEMDIFDVEGNLLGEPLFRVNFCGTHCSAIGSSAGRNFWSTVPPVKDQPDHDHLLWCVGDDQLFRCRIAQWYRNWPHAMQMPSETLIHTLGDLCQRFGVAESRLPKPPLSDLRVTVKQKENKYALKEILLYEVQEDEDGITHAGSKPFKTSNVLLNLLNEAAKERIERWSAGQERLMKLPQLYLTGLRR